ncbi:MAG: twin-arginine translocation signal domain-containing protein [Betaproteobacteria bacterium]|nr:twin-arginine translocation signal domain-containing protein [Betaproteobacteria bacterium]
MKRRSFVKATAAAGTILPITSPIMRMDRR